MTTYYSPSGNPEVWETKPTEYYSVEEWLDAHPQDPIPEITAEQRCELVNIAYAPKLAALDTALLNALWAGGDNEVTTRQELVNKRTTLLANKQTEILNILLGI